MCGECARKRTHPQERLATFLLEKLTLQDNGCPLERHELLNHEWAWLGVIKSERLEVAKEESGK